MAVRSDDRSSLADAAWATLALVGIAEFVILTWLMLTAAVVPFDQPLLDAATSLGAYRTAWSLLSDAANLPLIAIGAALVIGLFVTHHRRESGTVLVVLAVVTAGSELIKQLVARPRPPGGDVVVPGVVYSYPSGHVLEALTIFGIIAILLWRADHHRVAIAAGAFTIVFVSLVAVARVAINAHYPSDVLGGMLAGVGVLGCFALATPRDLSPSRRSEALPHAARPVTRQPLAPASDPYIVDAAGRDRSS